MIYHNAVATSNSGVKLMRERRSIPALTNLSSYTQQNMTIDPSYDSGVACAQAKGLCYAAAKVCI